MSTTPIVSIVDDDESVRLATASLVRSLGWSVRAYASAEDFLQSGEIASAACVISDVQMPGMTGVEMQDQLIAQGNALPIIFITAFPSEALRRKAVANGALCFLNKPIDVQEVTRYLESVLRGA
ncbi:response regulator receiver protein [Caballeronia glathei]|uniref:Response regulator receiver protein n=1 Tax=Caballeronia glathei TaxID=60547 RepID=A0A069PB46_9BURK|nr:MULTISPECIES: response regulator [Burkholderiaceae]KDR37880.1 response regulator receiver protein [Caballeronia glathei]TCK38217.1 response regulator receiver domain-containing protein [Paraburkholderia sp. BL8N3]CDY76002.1 response regulator receiver protein [Caballeronia glathei]